MVYVLLLGPVSFLDLGILLCAIILTFCSTVIFSCHLVFITATVKASASHRCDAIEGNIV